MAYMNQPIQADFYGEYFQSRRTGMYHWRLRRRENQYIVANSTGGKGRGYANLATCKQMFHNIHGNRYQLRKGEETR